MSYDIYLRAAPCPTCGHQVDPSADLPEPTYNLTPIFDLALTGEPMPNPEVGEGAVVLLRAKTDRPRGLRVLDGRAAKDTIEALRKAVGHVNDPTKAAAFRALEPENGWGDLAGARSVLARLLEAAEQYPDLVWEIH